MMNPERTAVTLKEQSYEILRIAADMFDSVK